MTTPPVLGAAPYHGGRTGLSNRQKRRIRRVRWLQLRLSDFREGRGRKTSGQEKVTMKKAIKTAGIRVKAGIKAGGIGPWNHNISIR